MIGKESRWALIAAGMIGAILVLVSDTVGRLLLQSGEIPAGIVICDHWCSVLFVLLIRQKRSRENFSRLRVCYLSPVFGTIRSRELVNYG